MDPQATWEQLLDAYAEGDSQRVEELADALLEWLKRGGFPPKATTGADLGPAWDGAIAAAACEFALVQATKEVTGAARG